MLIGIDASRSVTAQRTGTEAYAYFLTQALISQTVGSRHTLRLYFNEPPSPGLFPDSAHVEYRIIPFPRLWTHVQLARELQQNPPDVFFTPAHVIPFIYRGASVATVHDLGYHYFPQAHTKSQVAYLNLSTRMNGRLSRRIVADSSATKSDLMRLYHLDAGKIDVIYPGLDPTLKQVDDPRLMAAAWSKYQIKAPYMLFIGTLQPRKNLERLIHAYAQSGVDLDLVLAGKVGWQKTSLLETIASLDGSVRQRIHLPGFVAERDKSILLSGAQALLFPSLYEGFGFPVLEAQVCGTPVLAANSSSLPEITAGSALLIDPLDVEAMAEGIRQIAGSSELRQELIHKGFDNVRRFTWQKSADAVLRVLEQSAAL